jgi:hypothetical protein
MSDNAGGPSIAEDVLTPALKNDANAVGGAAGGK